MIITRYSLGKTKRKEVELVDANILEEDSTISENPLVEDKEWKEEMACCDEFQLLESLCSSYIWLQSKIKIEQIINISSYN